MSSVAAPSGRRPAPTRELMVPVEGGRVHVRIDGDLAGPRAPLLMVHGGPGGSHAAFLPALALADQRAIIVYDQLDCGRSDRPGDPAAWRIERFVGEIAAIRRTLGLDRLHLLGASWGGTIAAAYAADVPAGLRSLVLQGPLISTALWLQDAARLRARLPTAVQAALDACEAGPPPPAHIATAAVDAFYARFFRLRPPSRDVAEAEADPRSFNRRLYEAMWGPNEFRADGTLHGYDGLPGLATIEAPTLILIGDSDEVTPQTARLLAARMRDARIEVVADAAHRIQTDQPETYRAALARWCTEHDR